MSIERWPATDGREQVGDASEPLGEVDLAAGSRRSR